MNIYSAISLLVVPPALLLVIYVLRNKGYQKKANLWLALMTLVFAWWSFCYAFLFASATQESAWFWYKVSAIGWTFGVCFLSEFIISFAEIKPGFWIWLFRVFIWGSLLTSFLRVQFSTLFVTEFIIREHEVIREVAPHRPGVWLYLFLAGNSATAVFSSFILISMVKKSQNRRKKKQALSILLGELGGFILIYIFNVLPVFLIHWPLPAIGHYTIIVLIAAPAYAILRYKLFTPTVELAAEGIVSRIEDYILLLDYQGKIIEANKAARNALQPEGKDLIGDLIFQYFERGPVDKDLLHPAAGTKEMEKFHFHLKGRNGRIPVSISSSELFDKVGERIGTLVVAHDERQMYDLAEKQSILRIRNERIERELMLARTIQMQFIPRESPVEEIAFFYRPMDKLGGDYFDFVEFPESDEIGIFVSDVSGHGVPGALITSMMKSLLSDRREMAKDPARLLYHFNETMLKQTGNYFVTAFFGLYHRKNHRLKYAIAGHNLPYHITAEKASVLSGSDRGVPLGVLSEEEMALLGKSYRTREFQLQKGDKFLIYTDGLTETVPISKRLEDSPDFEKARLVRVLEENSGLDSSKFIEMLYINLVEFRGANSFDDDVCMVCLSVK